MTQPPLFTDTLTCPVCGYTGDLDDFECAGLPDGVVYCSGRVWPWFGKKSQVVDGKRVKIIWRCPTLIDVATGKEYTAELDDDC